MVAGRPDGTAVGSATEAAADWLAAIEGLTWADGLGDPAVQAPTSATPMRTRPILCMERIIGRWTAATLRHLTATSCGRQVRLDPRGQPMPPVSAAGSDGGEGGSVGASRPSNVAIRSGTKRSLKPATKAIVR